MPLLDEDEITGREVHSGRPRLERSDDRKIGGVCAGIGEFLGWDPWAIRALFILLGIPFFWVMVPAYALLWWIMPPKRGGRFQLDDFRKG